MYDKRIFAALNIEDNSTGFRTRTLRDVLARRSVKSSCMFVGTLS